MAKTAASLLAVGTRLEGRGVAVFSWSPSAPPFFVASVSCPFVTGYKQWSGMRSCLAYSLSRKSGAGLIL